MRKNNKRALIVSVLSLLLCVSMLVGSTMAWFTDNASTAVNTIQAGKLEIALEMWDGEKWVDAEGKTLGFVDDENKPIDNSTILWEPGCRYRVQPFRIVNKGNLNLKFKIVIGEILGDAELADAIEWGVSLGEVGNTSFVSLGGLNEFGEYFADTLGEKVLAPTKDMNTLEDEITFCMKTTAGNEYQGLSITGFSLLVQATQATVEEDSFDNQYDKDAEYDKLITEETDLSAALTAEGSGTILLGGDVTLSEVATITGNKAINLNGNTLTITEDRAIDVSNGTVTLSNGTIEYAGTDAPIMVEGTSELIINGATINVENTITGGTYGNAAGIIVNQGTGSVVTMNSGEINVTGANGGSGVYIAYAKGGNHTFNFNGGTINVETGKYGVGIECLSKNTLNLNGGTINMKDASEGWAFNVGQSQGSPTVVTGSGTTVNLYSATNTLYEDDDAAQFADVTLTVNSIY